MQIYDKIWSYMVKLYKFMARFGQLFWSYANILQNMDIIWQMWWSLVMAKYDQVLQNLARYIQIMQIYGHMTNDQGM